MAPSATFYGSFCLLLLSLVSAIELNKKGCLLGQISPSFHLPYQTDDGSQSFAPIRFDHKNVTVKVDITCSQPIIGHYKALLSMKEGNDSLQMTFESEKFFRSEVKLSSLSFSYMMDEDRFPNAGNDTGKVKTVRASDLITWPQKYAWACYDEASIFNLNVVNATFGLGPAEISVFSKTPKTIGATCASDKATYSAQVEGSKGVFAHMNFEAKFSIAYNQSVSEKNTTVTAVNKNLTITNPSASAVPAKGANETGVVFTVTFGSNSAQKSKLNFVFESKMNKTELKNVILVVYPTPDNGFVNASSKDALTLEMDAEKAGLAWNEAAKGGFKCDAPNTLSDGEKESSSLVLSAFRFQENKEAKTYTEEPTHCDADKKHTTTVAPTTTTMPPAPIKQYRYPPKGTPCILLKTGILFDIEYKVEEPKTNKTKTMKVRKEVPEHGVSVSGSCDVKEPNNVTEQELTLSFNKTWSLTFHISSDKKYTGNENGKAYAVYQVSLTGDVHDGNKTVVSFKGLENNATTDAFKDFLSGRMNKSVTCTDYKQKLSNDKVTVTMELADVTFEAFGANPNGTFSESEKCPGGGGSGSDIIPIIVGACLAALVVVVLVAYLIGRARARRGGYQSV